MPTTIFHQLVKDRRSWAYGLTPRQAERVTDWLLERGFFDDDASHA